MPHYYQNEEPSRPQWIPTTNNMNASIVLDKPANFSFTNLDELSGKVVLRLPKSTDLTSIVVKLEGESRTRLLSAGLQPEGGGKQRPQLEYHKVRELYRHADEEAPSMPLSSWRLCYDSQPCDIHPSSGPSALLIVIDLIQSPTGIPSTRCRGSYGSRVWEGSPDITSRYP